MCSKTRGVAAGAAVSRTQLQRKSRRRAAKPKRDRLVMGVEEDGKGVAR